MEEATLLRHQQTADAERPEDVFSRGVWERVKLLSIVFYFWNLFRTSEFEFRVFSFKKDVSLTIRGKL